MNTQILASTYRSNGRGYMLITTYLHDVGLVNGGHLLATVGDSVLEGVLGDATGGLACDNLETLHDTRLG